MTANIQNSSTLSKFLLAALVAMGFALPSAAFAQAPGDLFAGKTAKKPLAPGKAIALPYVKPSELGGDASASPAGPPQGSTVKPYFAQPSELGEDVNADPSLGDPSLPGGVPPTTTPPTDGMGETLPGDGGLLIPGGEEQPPLPGDVQEFPPSTPMQPNQPSQPLPNGPVPVNPGGIDPSNMFNRFPGSVSPSDLFHCQPQKCYYKAITTWTYKQVPYQVKVLKYDHCGHPYYAYVTQYKLVKVPVTQYVKVCY